MLEAKEEVIKFTNTHWDLNIYIYEKMSISFSFSLMTKTRVLITNGKKKRLKY
jgi:hypothetical protein